MKFAKLENNNIKVFTESFVRDEADGRLYVYPTAEQLRKCGYKEYIEAECVLEEKEGYDIIARYEETDGAIKQTWEYEEIPEEIYELPTA